MNDNFQAVYTVEEYYDGPRAGVADFEGRPHFYRSIYLDSPKWNANEDRFELSPVSPEVLAAACEADAISHRWDAMRRATPHYSWTDEEFGALPEERPRYLALGQYLESSYAAAAQARRFLVHGEFHLNDSPPSYYRVRWRIAEHDPMA